MIVRLKPSPYSGVGQLLSDSATAGYGIDSTVTSIDYAYKVCGRLLSVSSESGSTILNEDYYTYDTNGNLADEYQKSTARSNTSNLSAYPAVGYGYDGSIASEEDLTVAATGFRPTSVTYPSVDGGPARTVSYSYTASPTDNAINQLDGIADNSTTVDTVGYLGDGTIASEDYSLGGGENLGYNLLGTTQNQSNLDQFGRVADLVWGEYATGGSASLANAVDGYGYTYNALGDAASRQNLTDAALDQAYDYDTDDELTSLAGSPGHRRQPQRNAGFLGAGDGGDGQLQLLAKRVCKELARLDGTAGRHAIGGRSTGQIDQLPRGGSIRGQLQLIAKRVCNELTPACYRSRSNANSTCCQASSVVLSPTSSRPSGNPASTVTRPRLSRVRWSSWALSCASRSRNMTTCLPGRYWSSNACWWSDMSLPNSPTAPQPSRHTSVGPSTMTTGPVVLRASASPYKSCDFFMPLHDRYLGTSAGQSPT